MPDHSVTNLLRYRAQRDLALIRKRLAELEASGPLDDTVTLGDALAAIQKRRDERAVTEDA